MAGCESDNIMRGVGVWVRARAIAASSAVTEVEVSTVAEACGSAPGVPMTAMPKAGLLGYSAASTYTTLGEGE